MQHFYVWNFNKRRRLLTLLLIAFCTALLLFVNPTNVFQVFSKTEDVAVTRGNKDGNKLALTFNISWGDEKVYDILKVLKKNKTRATFFVSGEWAERHPQIIEKITEDEHEIGMLGYRYKNYLEQDIDQVRKDMIYAKEVFQKLDLENITYIRPPSGHFNDEIIELAESLDLEVIHWSVNPNDWENPGSETIKAHLKEAGSGDIILLHASDSAKQTAEVLKSMIPTFHEKKLSPVTISELINEVTIKERLVE